MLEQRDSLDPQPEGEALDPLRVVAGLGDEAAHVRVDHAGAEDLDPADPLAQRVARAVVERARAAAVEARDVDLDARLGEREEAGAEAGLAVRPEDRPGDGVER